MEVEYLPPYRPSEAEKADSTLFANNVQRLIATRLGVPTTQHSFEDVMLTNAALLEDYPFPDAGAIEVPSVRSARPKRTV